MSASTEEPKVMCREEDGKCRNAAHFAFAFNNEIRFACYSCTKKNTDPIEVLCFRVKGFCRSDFDRLSRLKETRSLGTDQREDHLIDDIADQVYSRVWKRLEKDMETKKTRNE